MTDDPGHTVLSVADDPPATIGRSNGAMTSDSAEAAAVAVLTKRLHDTFPPIPIGTVEQIVTQIYDSYDACRVREFISLLVERESHDRLRDLARAEHPMMARPPRTGEASPNEAAAGAPVPRITRSG